MGERGDHVSCFVDLGWINVGNHETGLFTTVRKHLAPRTDDQGMAKSLAVTGMSPALGGSDDIATRWPVTAKAHASAPSRLSG